jgi:hypothetical protein
VSYQQHAEIAAPCMSIFPPIINQACLTGASKKKGICRASQLRDQLGYNPTCLALMNISSPLKFF